MIDIDYSFIRLRETFEEACNMQEPPLATNLYFGQVHLLPGEQVPYLQITNGQTPIIIEDYTCYLVEQGTGVEYDITANVFVAPFIDVNGVAQVAFEIINIPYDLGGNLGHLRFETNGGQNYYSNLFACTVNNAEQTTRFDYRNTDVYWGTDYFTAGYTQSIRLNTYFDNFVSQDELPTYFRITNNQTVNQRAKVGDFYQYIFPQLNGWTAKRLKRILYGDYLYIDGVRSYAVKGFEMPEREGDTNVGIATFLVSRDESDLFTDSNQIYEGLLYSLFPESGSQFSIEDAADIDFIDVEFNQDITLNTITGTITNTTTSDTWNIVNESCAIIGENTLRISTDDIFDSNSGIYEISIAAGAITGELLGELSPAITGWTITVSNGDYSDVDYSTTDYLTNTI